MKLYRIRLAQRSPFGSAGHSDTLFGQLCWQQRFRSTESEFKEWLLRFDTKEPPFVVSDLFAGGRLPKPMIRVPFEKATHKADYAKQKAAKQARYLNETDFHAVCAGTPLTEVTGVSDGIASDERWQARLDRANGSTGGDGSSGQLFPTITWHVEARESSGFLDLYVRATEQGLAELLSLLRDLSRIGYGRDKGVGVGQFELATEHPQELDWDNLDHANGFVSLSSFVPAADDPTDGRWRLRVKYGRLGENAGGDNPFKKPLIQLEAGATFKTGSRPSPFYGRMVKELAPGFPEAVQCGLTVAVPIILRE
ncbi:MAG: hypothetical protein H6508_08195 [Calditrichaeota bacterium]|nr:hypothetical protein [Calditrichota bacterium]